jgi:hypothetical protein
MINFFIRFFSFLLSSFILFLKLFFNYRVLKSIDERKKSGNEKDVRLPLYQAPQNLPTPSTSAQPEDPLKQATLSWNTTSNRRWSQQPSDPLKQASFSWREKEDDQSGSLLENFFLIEFFKIVLVILSF